MEAILDGWLWLPYGAVADVAMLKKSLTFRPRKRGDVRPQPIHMFADDPGIRCIGVPPAWGLHQFGGHLDIIDQTSEGEPFLSPVTKPDHNHPAVTNPEAQAKFTADLERVVSGPGFRPVLAEAATGTGKTVVGAWIAGGVVRRKTLILTHLDRLNAQWITTFRDLLGVPPERIGEVQGGKRNWRDKDVVVGTLQTIGMSPGSQDPEFYRTFGTVIFDEVHRCGAPVFGQSVWQFPAAVKIGLSATMKRKDGADTVFIHHLGQVSVTSEQEALPLQVWPVWYQTRARLWGTEHGARMKCLSLDQERNAKLVKLICKMYSGGRQALVVGESIRHLQLLIDMCAVAGVPRHVMGQFTAEVNVTTQIRADGRMQTVTKKKKQPAAVLERIKRESQLIFATYGMIKEGIDIPRLDAGIDVTPRSDATQLIGRLRRPHEGKKEPILWVTMVDVECDRSLRYYQQRLAEYNSAGAEVIDRR